MQKVREIRCHYITLHYITLYLFVSGAEEESCRLQLLG